MNYGAVLNNGQKIDLNYERLAGWAEGDVEKSFFNMGVVRLISKKVSELTKGVDQNNRTIVVPDERIAEVMNGVYVKYEAPIGDIYSRFIIPTTEQQDMVINLIDQTIEIIVNNIVNQLGMEQQNNTLSAWVQVYGDFNTSGLRQHPPIKVRQKRPSTMQFNMNY